MALAQCYGLAATSAFCNDVLRVRALTGPGALGTTEVGSSCIERRRQRRTNL